MSRRENFSESPNRRILLIDDNLAIHKDLAKVLVPEQPTREFRNAEAALFGLARVESARPAYDLDSAFQGQEGLERVARSVREGTPYAMAFVDMRMPPGWDGLETCERLREVDPLLQLVICTAYSDFSWAEITGRLGRNSRLLILKKPFNDAEVCQLAAALTEKWDLARKAELRERELERIVAARTEELRRKEQQLRRKCTLEAIGSLAGGVAHEFNNLLQVIRGYVQFAMDDLAEESSTWKDLGYVVDAVDRAADITGQLLKFSRSGEEALSVERTNSLVSMTMNMVAPLLGETVALEVALAEDAGAVLIDAGLLSQAILNLCVNARDAMPSGGRLRVSTKRVDVGMPGSAEDDTVLPAVPPGVYGVISVKDSGCGMTRETQRRAFEPFFTTKEVGKGTGMGLAMVFGAARQHEGDVTMESDVGVGTTVSIWLPLVDAECPTTPPVQEGGTVGVRGGNETVLVAEDNAAVRHVAVRILRDAGYRVLEASDGAEAVKQLEEHGGSVRAALLDVVMPKLSGHEVRKHVERTGLDVRVIMCTGYDPETSHVEQCTGRVPIVYKPCSPDELLRLVRRVLDRKDTAEAITA